jgi:hypothetical protein
MTDLGGKGWYDMDWFDLVQDRNPWRDLLNIFNELKITRNILSSCTAAGLSRRVQLHERNHQARR